MEMSSQVIESEEIPESTQEAHKVQLLLIEDSPTDKLLFEKILSRASDDSRYHLVHVKRLSKAIKFLQKQKFDAIILDLHLPDSQGVEAIDEIKKENPGCPILVLTGMNDQATGVEAVRRGAQDFLVKGSIDGNALSESIRFAMERHKIVSSIEKEKDRQAYFAAHDQLTGLPNLKFLRFQLDHAVAQGQRSERMFAVLFIDIDDFKTVNDSYGHTAADELLKAFTKRLTGSLRGGDTAARVGGDEFVVILNDIKRIEDAATAAQRLLTNITCNYKIQSQYISPTFSMGISVFPRDEKTAEGLVSAADFAMLQAKQIGKNRFCYFSANMNVKAQEAKELEARLELALQQGELEVYYQPEFKLEGEQIVGVQALVRWNHPQLGLVPARHFVPFIEYRDFILRLNEWILETGANQIKTWEKAGYNGLYLSLNLAPLAFKNEDFLIRLGKSIKKCGIDPHTLRFEVRESDILADRERHLAFLKDLQSFGVQILLDGFGTGFSSMTALEKLPITGLKIDRSVIQKAGYSEESQAMLRAILQLTHGFGIKSIAEGVETREQFEILKHCGCEIAQGFYLSKPVPHQLLTVTLKGKYNL